MIPLNGQVWLYPGQLVVWLLVGLIAGGLAARIMGSGSGLLDDLVLGLVGAFAGGSVVGLLSTSTVAFVGSIVGSAVAAVLALAVSRMLRSGIPEDTIIRF